MSGLSRYTGTFGKTQAAHLLRRTLFGPKKAEIAQAAGLGLSGTIDRLFGPRTLPEPPVNFFYTEDPNVPVGATWINSPHVEGADVGRYRWPSLRGWYFQSLINSEFNIMEKMAMFWINHFGMSDVGEHRAQYQYLQMMRRWGAGNFRTIVEEITAHPSMLAFLNGDYSTKWEPNENYARELLELFTIQKGPQVAPEDYTYYTEDDIRAAARVLTGLSVQGMWSREDVPVAMRWRGDWHDEGDKQFSHRFGNRVITNNGQNEYKDLIAMIFEQDRVSESIARELYRYFVYYELSPAVERDVIAPMAAMIRDNGYVLEPALKALLSSQHFFDMANRGPMIKNPYDFMMSIARPLGGHNWLGEGLEVTYRIGTSYHWWGENQNMDFLYPPTVAGWKAYYQAPAYYRAWISSATLQQRRRLVNDLTWKGIWAKGGPRALNWLAFIDGLDNRYQVNDMIAEIVEVFLPRPLVQAQLDGLKDELINGLPDMEWTRQYSDYVANPYNPDVVRPLEDKVKKFFRALFSMAEFQLQ